jgi:hypothetical protein
MDIHFDWQVCNSSEKNAFRLRGELILLFKGKKTFEIYDFHDFQSSQSSQENIHPSNFFPSRSFSAAFGNAAATDCNKATL